MSAQRAKRVAKRTLLLREQGVASSNLVIPTISTMRATFPRSLFLFVLRSMSDPKYPSEWQFDDSQDVVLCVPGRGFISGALPGRSYNLGVVRISHFCQSEHLRAMQQYK